MKKLSHVLDEKVELENPIVLKLNSHLLFWKRYVDYALTIVKKGPSYHVLSQLNSFYPNIQFTFEREPRGGIPFLGILVIWKKSSIETVYKNSTDRGIISTGSHLHQHMKTRNVQKFSTPSVLYLLYRISFEEGMVTPRKNVYL